MMTRKFLIPFVLASLAGHALVLALATRVDWTGTSPTKEVTTVELKTLPENDARPEPSRREEPSQAADAGEEDDFREDSVTLQGENTRYGGYLLSIRRKIERLWSYPAQALLEQKEGNAVIRFTIAANGDLSGYRVMSTSGSAILDKGALAVVRAAAPYAPFPSDFNLSRLHITAVFSYRMDR